MITYQQEFLSTCEEESKELLQKHWEEIALNKEKIKLNPDWETYHILEDSGHFKIFTVRCSEELIGYFAVFINTNPHYKDHLFAANDVLYLSPEYRKGLIGAKLIKFAEKCLKEDSVSVLSINTKAHQPFDKLLVWLGFRLVDRVYNKFLGD